MKDLVYLVTGATGFLGSEVCRQLINDNKKVKAFVLPNDKAVKYLPEGIEIIYGDLTNKDDLEKLFKVGSNQESVILHIGSIVTVDPEFNQRVIDVNVGGTKNIIDLCKEHKECKRLVYCSSTGAIKETKKIIKETTEISASNVQGCYSQSKALATKEVLDAYKKDDLDVVVVHPSGIFGPNDFAIGQTTSVTIDILKGKMKAGINGTFNLCDVRDLANGIINAVTLGKKGECYILANEAVTFKKFAKILFDVSGCKKMKTFIPTWLASIIAKKMEKKAKKTNQKPLMTSFSVYNLARNNNFDSTKAKNDLNYKIRSYEETIKDQVNWLKKRI